MAANGSGTTRLLIIDDSHLDRMLFRRTLREAPLTHFEVIEAERGNEGFERVVSTKPDCILLDLNLPDVEGLDLLDRILAVPLVGPVIVTTAYGSEQIAVQAMKSGAADYLVKSSNTVGALSHTIGKALEKRELLKQIEEQRLALRERNRELEAALKGEKIARREAEESEHRYRTLARAMPQVVWSAGHPNGEFDYVNEQWSRLTGAQTDAAYGNGWLEFVSAEDRSRVQSAWQYACHRTNTFELECRLRAGDGTERWQLMRAAPLFEDQSAAKWFGTFTDIEDQKRAEQILRQKQKLQSIGLLAGGIAHDFNNLLVGMIGGVSYALETLPTNHELAPMLETSLKSGERAAHLTRQLLAYAGKGRFLIERFDLSKLVQSTVELIRGAIPKGVELKLLNSPDLPYIETDSSQMQQVVMNLIINAAESFAAGARGVIVVRTARERLDERRTMLMTVLEPGEYVLMEVLDNGSGMDAETQAKIFDPFFTTKFTGRGLGLAAVQGILQSNNGGIEVKSTPGLGSRFRVVVPVAPHKTEPSPDQVPTAAEVPRAPKARILVVDDEQIVRSTARASLERAGHVVTEASSGEEALRLLRIEPSAFVLVILDLSMPGMSGQETLGEIRQINPALPVLVCSGYSASEMENQFAGLGVDGFLEKPFTSKVLQSKVGLTMTSPRTSSN